MSSTQTLLESRQVILRTPFAEVLRNPKNGQQQLNSLKSYKPGDIISSFHAGETVSVPTYLTVQIGVDKHITLRPEFLQYINHSCDPNVFFDTTNMELVCLSPVNAGDEFTFFYPSTEWEMTQTFLCQCSSPKCLQLIQGAKFLSTETIQQYRFTDFIQQQLDRKAEPEEA